MLLFARFVATLKIKCPVSGTKNCIQLSRQQVNVATIYLGCYTYCDGLEIKCLVSGTKRLMHITFENCVVPTPNR